MSRFDGPSVFPDRSGGSRGSATVTMGSCSGSRCTLDIEGALLTPLDGQLPRAVRALLGRGERHIVLNLAAVPRIDAGGIGELVRAYNMAVAAHAVLRIVHSTAWVRELLQRIGLFEILSEGGAGYRVTAAAV